MSAKIIDWYIAHDGLSEVRGPRSNPMIIAWIRRFFAGSTDDSTIAWCGIARHEAALATDTPSVPKPFRARSWLAYGEAIAIDEIEPGDTVVFRRGAAGHVGVYGGPHVDGRVFVWGGNQGNKISRAVYPIRDILGVRGGACFVSLRNRPIYIDPRQQRRSSASRMLPRARSTYARGSACMRARCSATHVSGFSFSHSSR